MPYHLMTDEFIRDRLAAGEAQRLAAAPGEVVQYDGARWMRSGEVWVLEDPARARFELAPADSVSDDADTVDVYLTAAQAASAGTEPVQARSAAAAELPPGSPVAALPAGPAEPPADAHATGIAVRRLRRRWIFTGAACVAAPAAVAVSAVT